MTIPRTDKIVVTCNPVWRPFVFRRDVPRDVIKSQFKHLDDDDDFYFKYREYWYHVSDFMLFKEGKPDAFRNWDAYFSESYFSGVLLKLSKNGEMYQVGRYYI